MCEICGCIGESNERSGFDNTTRAGLRCCEARVVPALELKDSARNEQAAQTILDEARKFVTYCADFFALTSDDK